MFFCKKNISMISYRWILEFILKTETMTERNNAKSASDTIFTTKGDEVLSCRVNVHPAIGTEYSCHWSKGEVYIDKKLPSEKIFDKDFHIEQDGIIIGKKNQNGDLLVSPELTNNRTLIIRKKDLWTNVPPKGSTLTKVDSASDAEILMTPEWVWISQEQRELDHDEIMKLIIKKLQELDTRKRKEIGPRASIDDNLSILQERIETA